MKRILTVWSMHDDGDDDDDEDDIGDDDDPQSPGSLAFTKTTQLSK